MKKAFFSDYELAYRKNADKEIIAAEEMLIKQLQPSWNRKK